MKTVDMSTSSQLVAMSDKGASMAVYASSAGAVGSGTTVFWANPSTIAAIIGACCAVGGLVIAYANYRLNRKYKQMHYELVRDKTYGDDSKDWR